MSSSKDALMKELSPEEIGEVSGGSDLWELMNAVYSDVLHKKKSPYHIERFVPGSTTSVGFR